jgi:ABC-2 type transport system permease protein
MKVFNACMIVIKRRFGSFILYFAVFITLSVVLTALMFEQFNTDFSTVRPNFTVINRDGDSYFTNGLISYLKEHGNEIIYEDNKRTLQDATFYRATDYIVFLPFGFRDSFLSGNHVELETVITTESAKGYYADSMVNQYLNLARVYLTTGSWDEEELVSAVLYDLSLEADAEKKWFDENTPVSLNFVMYYQMMVYILLVLNIVCVTHITMVFRRSDIRMRNLCSPLKPRAQSGQQILCCGVLSLLAWLLLLATGFAMYGSGLGGTNGSVIALMLLNSFVFSITALAFAALIGSFVNSPNAQHAAANIGALGLCFLGGVFVPLDILGPGVLAIARFLPTYWSVAALNHISTLTSFNAENLQFVWQSFLIQLVFAATFFCVALLINKLKNQSERYISTARTELEA